MKSATELSNLKCQRAAPTQKPYYLADGGGLYLLITPAGGKLWRWRYRFQGKEKQMAFGKYPDVPLADARSYHADARKLLANGVDPLTLRKETKEQEKVELAEAAIERPRGLTFGVLTLKWFDWWEVKKNEKHAANVKARLEADIIPQLGGKLPQEITRMEVVGITKAVEARGARDIAKRNLQIVRRVYTYGMNHGLLDQNTLNPAADIKPDQILSQAKEEHFASLPVREIPELLRKMQTTTALNLP